MKLETDSFRKVLSKNTRHRFIEISIGLSEKKKKRKLTENDFSCFAGRKQSLNELIEFTCRFVGENSQ